MFWMIASTIIAAVIAITMIFLRLKTAKQPATTKKIILPPLFMSTGAAMFIFPFFQIMWLQVIEALLVGIVFSIPLIITSKFEIKENQIYLIPSKAFIYILIFLLVIRIGFKFIIGSSISIGETSGMFFLLALGMIGTWRIAMLYKYKKIKNKIKRVPFTLK